MTLSNLTSLQRDAKLTKFFLLGGTVSNLALNVPILKLEDHPYFVSGKVTDLQFIKSQNVPASSPPPANRAVPMSMQENDGLSKDLTSNES